MNRTARLLLQNASMYPPLPDSRQGGLRMRERMPHLTSREMYRSGMNIGRDLIGANCQTLILAFTGSMLTTLMVVIAVVLTVPFSAALTALAVKQKPPLRIGDE